MQKGKIIEQGNHDYLLSQYPEGLYAKFVKEQQQSEQESSPPDTSMSKVLEEDSSMSVRKRSTFKKKRDANLNEDP